MKNVMRNMSLFLGVLLLSYSAFADEVVYKCTLKPLQGVGHYEGTIEIVKNDTNEYRLKLDAVMKEDDEEDSAFQHEEAVKTQFYTEQTKPTAEEFVSSDDQYSEVRKELLGKEKLKSLSTYVTLGFADDGNGVVLDVFTTVSGKVKSLATIGWGFALCE